MPLTLKAFDLLQLLAENQGHLLEKDEILRRVWPDSVVEENNLTVTISSLRKALGEDPNDRQYIETVPRRGYRFVADLRSADGAEAGPAPAAPTARTLPLKAALAACALLAVGLGWLWSRSSGPSAPAPVRSMAVLPFRSLDDEHEYLGLGMADALITRLGGTKLLVVRSTGTVRRYSTPDLDPVAAGRDLRVESVLEGSMQAAGGRLRTTVRLLRVSDGSALWAGTFDEPLTDIFTVQDAISERVAAALALELTEAERSLLTRRYTSDTEAYQLYLKGRFFWNKRTRDGFERGITCFQQAIAKDPSYALAWSGLADSYIGLAFYHYAAPHEAMPRAREAAARALQTDDALAEAHASLAHVKANYEWDWAAAEREWKAAIALKPEYATAHQWYAVHHLAPMGRMEEAIAEARARAGPRTALRRLQRLPRRHLPLRAAVRRGHRGVPQGDRPPSRVRRRPLVPGPRLPQEGPLRSSGARAPERRDVVRRQPPDEGHAGGRPGGVG